MKRHKLAWLNLCQPARNDAATIDRAYRSSGSRSFERIVRNPSAYREKVRRKVNVGLHRDEMIRAARGPPNLVRDRFCAQPRPLIEAGRRPNVHEWAHRAGNRMHVTEQRR